MNNKPKTETVLHDHSARCGVHHRGAHSDPECDSANHHESHKNTASGGPDCQPERSFQPYSPVIIDLNGRVSLKLPGGLHVPL